MLEDALHRADDLCEDEDYDTLVAEIDVSEFVPYLPNMDHRCGSLSIDGIRHPAESSLMFPMRAVGRVFSLEPGLIQRSEWLAVDFILPDFITRTTL